MSDLIRVSDGEREAVAEQLRRAHADGRIDTAELEERVERCYAARTRAELEPLVADLPSGRERRGRQGRARSSAFAFPPVLLLLPLLAVVAATGHFAFPLFPILFFVVLRFGRRGTYRHR